jgi:hypothetical protein
MRLDVPAYYGVKSSSVDFIVYNAKTQTFNSETLSDKTAHEI